MEVGSCGPNGNSQWYLVLQLVQLVQLVQVVVERSDKTCLKTFEGCLAVLGGAK